MGSNPQQLKGVIEFCVLKIISQKPTYGYEILSQLKSTGFSNFTESTLYPLLFRLEQRKAVTVERFSSPKGPSRKYYIVTSHGLNELHQFRENWFELCQLVDKVFEEESK